jgi:hypothetical protein
VDVPGCVVLDEVLGVERRDHRVIVEGEDEDGEGRNVSEINDSGRIESIVEVFSEDNIFVDHREHAVRASNCQLNHVLNVGVAIV